MNVKEKITPKDMQELSNLMLEFKVLANLLNHHRRMLDDKAKEVVRYLTPNPELYQLDLDRWKLKLKPKALMVPPGQIVIPEIRHN